jgi:hypothetical protein
LTVFLRLVSVIIVSFPQSRNHLHETKPFLKAIATI